MNWHTLSNATAWMLDDPRVKFAISPWVGLLTSAAGTVYAGSPGLARIRASQGACCGAADG